MKGDLELVMGETEVFEALNQLNQLLRKIIWCLKHLEQHMLATTAGENVVKASRTQPKLTKQMEMFFRNVVKKN